MHEKIQTSKEPEQLLLWSDNGGLLIFESVKTFGFAGSIRAKITENTTHFHLDSILEFNDWIKQYCSDEEIAVLDLEKALHVNDSDRAPDPGYDSGDGLHPNELAYAEKLDNILIPALEIALEIGH